MKRILLAAAIGLVAMGGLGTFSSDTAEAHDRVRRGRYFGNGPHDTVPHWHRTRTPFGTIRWYGLGPHDFRPHVHRYNHRSYRGISITPFGRTTSYYPRYPHGYCAPW